MSTIINASDFSEKELLADNNYLYLIFNRGFIWPFCQKHMLQLQQKLDFLKQQKIAVAVVVPDKKAKLDKYLANNPLDLNFVLDDKHQVADKYQQEVKLLRLGRMPAQIVLNNQLKPVYQHFAKSMADIVAEEIIFQEIGENNE